MVEALESELDSENLTMEKVKERLRAKFKRMQKSDVSSTEEKALVTSQSAKGKKFKGTCYNCGKYGHKGADCCNKDKKTEGGDTKKFEGNCHYCKKPGHKMEDCYKKKNADKKKGETAQASAEVVLMAADNISIDEDIWLGDSAATSHMVKSPWKGCLTSKRPM